MTKTQSTYLLGYQQAELERLISQANYLGEQSETILTLAGIGPGMKVLDLGCGPGDVTFLAAKLVGPEGFVLGVDASPASIELAEKRARRLGLRNMRFLARDIEQLQESDLMQAGYQSDHKLDAVIGRLVLMYLSDASATLKHLANFVRPNGILCFQEPDIRPAPSEPPCELYDRAVTWVLQAFRASDRDLCFGLRQAEIFRRAGLGMPNMRTLARVERAEQGAVIEHLVQATRTLLPVITSHQIAGSEDVDIDTLAARLRDEAIQRSATLTGLALVGAWSRVCAVAQPQAA